MRLVLQPDDNVAHADLLQKRGAYEWWYFDALADDGVWALTAIWFLGNPFSPYYRHSLRGKFASPYVHNALFFALYQHGRLHAYHFTRFAEAQISADPQRPACLRFGPNTLAWDGQTYLLSLTDENANRRQMQATLRFHAPSLVPVSLPLGSEHDSHCWLPAAPACHVDGEIALREQANSSAEHVRFRGLGYHDHNWGTLPFDRDIRDWYWARASLDASRAVLLYHVRYHHGPPVSHLLCFEQGHLVHHDPAAQVRLRRVRVNGFLMPYATQLEAASGEWAATFSLSARLDSAPFYLRTLCRTTVHHGARIEQGLGMAEYFKPRGLGGALVASATKARIVDRSNDVFPLLP